VVFLASQLRRLEGQHGRRQRDDSRSEQFESVHRWERRAARSRAAHWDQDHTRQL